MEQTVTGVPVWASPASGGTFSIDGTDSGDKASLEVTGMTGRDLTQIFFQVEPSTISTSAYPICQVSGQTADYDVQNQNQYGTGAPTVTTNHSCDGYFLDEEAGHTSELINVGVMYIYKGIGTLEFTGSFMTQQSLTFRADAVHMANIVYGGGCQIGTGDIDSIKFKMTSGNISGKIQVNSMNYV